MEQSLGELVEVSRGRLCHIKHNGARHNQALHPVESVHNTVVFSAKIDCYS